MQDDPPGDPSLHRTSLIKREVDTSVPTQGLENSSQFIPSRYVFVGFSGNFLQIRVTGNLLQFPGDLRRSERGVDPPRGECIPRHAKIFRRFLRLREGDPAFRLDQPQAYGS